MKSVMVHSFSQVPKVDIPRSSFDRSHGHKTTLDADYLVPVFVDDVIPGDTFNCKMHFFGRLASPTLHPLMDNLYLDSFFFFVPYRLVWKNFEKFHGSQDDPGDSIAFTIPTLSNASWNNAATNDTALLAQYLGLPWHSAIVGTEVSCLPSRS